MAKLILKHNETLCTNFSAAVSKIQESMSVENVAQGELWVASYNSEGDTAAGAVLGLKDKNGVVIFCDAAHVTAEMRTALESYATTESVNTLLQSYYQKSEIDNIVSGLETKITAAKEEVQKAAISVKAGNGISVTGEGTEKTIAQNIDLKIVNVDGVEKIQIIDKTTNSTVIAEVDASKFVVDGMLENAVYSHDTQKITLTWNTAGGSKTIDVDLSALVDVYTAGDGLVLEGNKFSVKVDTTSEGAENFLSVGEGGVKVSGVQEAINTAKETAIADAQTKIEALDVETIGEEGKFIQSVSQSDGKISAVAVDLTATNVKATVENATGATVQEVLSNLASRIQTSEAGGLTSITSTTLKITGEGNSRTIELETIDCGTY